MENAHPKRGARWLLFLEELDDLADERGHHDQCEDAHEKEGIAVDVLQSIEFSEQGKDAASDADEQRIEEQLHHGVAQVCLKFLPIFLKFQKGYSIFRRF